MNSDEKTEEELVSFLKALYGENSQGYLTLWTLKDQKTRWFKATDFARIADEALHLATEDDVYFGLGLRRERLEKKQRGSVEHVIAIPGLWADIDVRGAAHTGTRLPPTEDAARELLKDFPLSPTIVVNSGHGFQVWWLFKELWRFDTDEERQQAQALSRNFQATLQELARRHGWRIDPTPDLARILRLPGTWNRKLQPARVRISKMDKTRRYSPTDFDEYLLAEIPQRSSQQVGEKIRDGQRNKNLTSLAGTMRRRGLTAEEMVPSLLAVNASRCDPPLPEDEVRGLARSISRYPSGEEAEVVSISEESDVGVLHLFDYRGLATVEWLWPSWFPKGYLSLIVGESGVGKSWFAARLIAAAIGRLPWPDKTIGKPHKVVLVETEEFRIPYLNRLENMGVVDKDPIIYPVPSGESDPLWYVPQLPQDLDLVKKILQKEGSWLVVVDSLAGGHSLDENSAEMRYLLQELGGLAARNAVPVIVTHHLRKKSPYEPDFAPVTLDRIRGSSTIAQFARSIVGLSQFELFGPVRAEVIKANLAAPPAAVGFRIEEKKLVLCEPPSPPRKMMAIDVAIEFLRIELEKEPQRFTDLLAKAKKEEISKNTLYRARNALRIVNVKGRWSLPAASEGPL